MKRYFSHPLLLTLLGIACASLPFSASAQDFIDDVELTAVFIFIFVMMAIVCVFLLFHIWSSRKKQFEGDHEFKDLIVSASIGGYYYWEAKNNQSEFSLNLAKMLNLRNDIVTFEQACPLFKNHGEALLKEYQALKDGKKNSFLINLNVSIAGEDKHFQCSANRVTDQEGTTQGVILWFFDISEYITEFDTILHENSHLKKDLNLYTNVLNALPNPIWQRDEGFQMHYHNNAYEHFVEHSPSSDEENQALYDNETSLAKKAWEMGQITYDKHHLILEGERKLYEVTEIPLHDQKMVVGTAQDISGIEKIEKEIELHVSAHAELLESSSSAMAIYGGDTRLKFFNNAFCKLWGLEEKWLNQSPTYAEILETLRERRKLPEQANFKEFRTQQLQLFKDLIKPFNDFFYLPDGRALRVIVIPHALGGLLFSYEDMSDKLAIERSYNTLIAVQQTTLDNLKEAIAVFGEDGRLKLHNPNYMRILGHSPKSLEGEPHISALLDHAKPLFSYGKNWEKYRDKLIADMANREGKTRRLDMADGRIFDRTTVPLPDGATLVSYMDITDSILVERSLREKNEALEEADRVKTQFLANVSYELRTPLTSVLGLSEMLLQQIPGELNEKQQYYVENIHKSSNQLMSLINDILDLSTIGAGQLVLEAKKIDILPLLKQMKQFVEDSHQDEAHAAINIIEEDAAGTLLADEKRLRQVVLSLLNNALKFTPPEGNITIGVKNASRGEVMLWVEDDGVGIESTELEKVFDQFHKTELASARSISGAGLGLAVAKNIVELHGGRIKLESEPDKGTKVICYLKRNNKSLLTKNDA